MYETTWTRKVAFALKTLAFVELAFGGLVGAVSLFAGAAVLDLFADGQDKHAADAEATRRHAEEMAAIRARSKARVAAFSRN